MTYDEPSRRRKHTGAFRQTTSSHSLRAVLQSLIDADPSPRDNMPEILERLYEHYRAHTEMYERGVVVDYWGENNFNSLMAVRRAPSQHERRERSARAEQVARTQIKSAIHREASRLLDEIVPMLNKPLRDCTISECRKAAPQAQRWANLLGAIGQSTHQGTVGTHFTEAELRKLDRGG